MRLVWMNRSEAWYGIHGSTRFSGTLKREYANKNKPLELMGNYPDGIPCARIPMEHEQCSKVDMSFHRTGWQMRCSPQLL